MGAARPAPRQAVAAAWLRVLRDSRVVRRLASPQVAILAAYLAVTVVFFSGGWRSPRSSWIGVDGDPIIVLFYLKWIPFALSHGHSPLTTNYLDYPSGLNVMWNVAMILPALVLWPLTATLGVVFAYNVLITVGLAMSCWCAYLAIRRFTPTHVGPAIGGLLYGFSPYMIPQLMGHIQMSLVVFPPLTLIALHEILVVQRHRAVVAGALFGLAVAAQLLTGEEVLATTAIVSAIGTAVLCAMHPRAVALRLRHAATALGVAAAIALVISAYPLGVQFLGPQRIHGPLFPDGIFVTDLASLVVPSTYQHFNTPASITMTQHFTGGVGEISAYLGIPLLVLLPVAVAIGWSVRVVRLAAVLAVIVAVLSLGPTLHLGGRVTDIWLPWSLVQHLPLIDSALPARLWLYIWLLIALVLGVAVARALAMRRLWLRAVAAVVLALALTPLYPRTPFPDTSAETPLFFTSDAVRRIPDGSVVLVDPYAHGLAPEAMLWQETAGLRFRMPEGYGINPGEPYPSFDPPQSVLGTLLIRLDRGASPPLMTPELRVQLLADLRRLGVGTILVPPEARAATALFTDLIHRPPEIVGGMGVWWNVDAPSR